MRRMRPWPAGLTGRVTFVLLVALLVEFLGTVLVFGETDRLLIRTGRAQRLAEQLVVADRVLLDTPRALRPRVAANLSTQHVRFRWRADLPDGRWRTTAGTRTVAASVRSWQSNLSDRTLRFGLADDRAADDPDDVLVGALQLADGSWLDLASVEPIRRWATPADTLLRVAILAGAVLLVSALLVRTLAAPVRALADTADRIGFADSGVHVEEQGPRELRRLAHAFNAMQDRIRQLLDARTQALVAVSHDLRTPLSRLKLRLGAAGGTPDAAVGDDLDDMEAMLGSLLDYLRDGTEASFARLNLASLVRLVVEAAEDAGGDVGYDGPDRLDVVADRVALRRALENLVGNALKYGGDARVTLRRARDVAAIAIRDTGPGMAEADLLRAREPFFRADAARSRDTGGFGLGLAIAERVAGLHGGTLSLQNRPSGGLEACLLIPLNPVA